MSGAESQRHFPCSAGAAVSLALQEGDHSKIIRQIKLLGFAYHGFLIVASCPRLHYRQEGQEASRCPKSRNHGQCRNHLLSVCPI
jgi:hypothetical protein